MRKKDKPKIENFYRKIIDQYSQYWSTQLFECLKLSDWSFDLVSNRTPVFGKSLFKRVIWFILRMIMEAESFNKGLWRTQLFWINLIWPLGISISHWSIPWKHKYVNKLFLHNLNIEYFYENHYPKSLTILYIEKYQFLDEEHFMISMITRIV